MSNQYELRPIGAVETGPGGTTIRLAADYARGLRHLGEFSHCILIFAAGGTPPFCSAVAEMQTVDEKAGTVTLAGNWACLAGRAVYDLKPWFPCEDRVRDSVATAPAPAIPAPDESGSATLRPLGRITKERGIYYLVPEDFAACVKALEGATHVKVFWWFHRFDKPAYRRVVTGDPPYENAPRTGVFATRSPVRPNPIALTTARILAVEPEAGRLRVSGLDCFDGTPLLAAEPYRAATDRVDNFRVPRWLAHWPEWLDDRDSAAGKSAETAVDSGRELLLRADRTRGTSPGFSPEPPEKDEAPQAEIRVEGARQNNLKNVSLCIPHQAVTVITGVSGSGKSSLAFDTIHAESRRRFLDTMGTGSTLEKPRVDKITGLPPSIAVSQRGIARNPRSTVGTMSGIQSRLRVLFAAIGVRHCPECGEAVLTMTADEILHLLEGLETAEVTPYGGEEAGFRFPAADAAPRLRAALESGRGAVWVRTDDEEVLVQTTQMCHRCDHILFEMTPALFSFNNPESMCPVCGGLGVSMEVDADTIVTRPHLSILDGASDWWGELRKFRDNPNANWMKGEVLALADSMGADLEKPWEALPKDFRHAAVYGSGGGEVSFTYHNKRNGRSGTITRPAEGAYNILRRYFAEGASGEAARKIADRFMKQASCATCGGERLATEGRLVTVAGQSLPGLGAYTVTELARWVGNLPPRLTAAEASLAAPLLTDMLRTLRAFGQVGLSYLTLDRAVPTLSGGELQRLRLLSQLGTGIAGVLYVLDEPTAGLHPRDYGHLTRILRRLRGEGNTVLVVEHSAPIMREADYLVDVGPGAGIHGGEIVAEGTPAEVAANPNSPTGRYLSGRESCALPPRPLTDRGWVEVAGATANNLRGIDVRFPLGAVTAVTGVSGSGKSSLVSGVLRPAVENTLAGLGPGRCCGELRGAGEIARIVHVDQSPIGRSPRSNPCTYTGLMDGIREVFAATGEAKRRGYKAARFSFNSREGQCDSCKGEGRKCTPVPFMADIWTTCPVCGGRRYKAEVLEVLYNGKSIFEVLELSVGEARLFFADRPKLAEALGVLEEVGLGYLTLGQSALTLSGGEAQRIKLAKHLVENSGGAALYLLDEPTAGLHFADVKKLLFLLRRLTDSGGTVVVVEHNPDVVRSADWVIDLGPEGGDGGGSLVAMGTPDGVAAVAESRTGAVLRGE